MQPLDVQVGVGHRLDLTLQVHVVTFDNILAILRVFFFSLHKAFFVFEIA